MFFKQTIYKRTISVYAVMSSMEEEKKTRLYVIIGEKVKKYRGKHSQEKLAEMVNLSRASIANIEKGRQRPSIDILWSIATVLEIDPHLLQPTVEEMKIEYDAMYLKQLELTDSGRKWIEKVIEEGATTNAESCK